MRPYILMSTLLLLATSLSAVMPREVKCLCSPFRARHAAPTQDILKHDSIRSIYYLGFSDDSTQEKNEAINAPILQLLEHRELYELSPNLNVILQEDRQYLITFNNGSIAMVVFYEKQGCFMVRSETTAYFLQPKVPLNK